MLLSNVFEVDHHKAASLPRLGAQPYDKVEGGACPRLFRAVEGLG